MRVLVINGSPKGTNSNTYRLTCAFLEGMKRAVTGQVKVEDPAAGLQGGAGAKSQGSFEVRELTVSRLQIKPCLGCFACWKKTPGKCCIADDMTQVLEALLWADVTIWSFPLYYFSVPGALKNLMDRQLPMVLPFMEKGAESGGHETRYDMSGKRSVVISTCGFYTAKGNYDGVNAIFDHLCGKGNYTAIYCGQGELFRVKELSARTDAYLEIVKKAGEEYCEDGIQEQTREELGQLLFPRETFEAMADASWGIEDTGEKADDTLIFTRQMAALYRKENYPGKKIVLEMYYTDVDKRYQILLEDTGSRVLTEDFRDATTRIETPYTVWKAIAAGEISGAEAMMKQQYRVKGDFDLMIKWDTYFGGAEAGAGGQDRTQAAASSGEDGDAQAPENSDSRSGCHATNGVSASTNMNIMLIPWIVFWVAAAIHPFYGSLISIFACAAVNLFYVHNKKTVYDGLSGVLVTVFSAVLLLGAKARIVVPLSYLGFGIMWTVSSFMKLPLTAHYSMNDYDGEAALKNPLFIKTNRILTLCWGILYLLTPIWTWFLMGSSIAGLTGAVNSVLPMLMGVFTAWFQKWYPAKVARG